MPVLAAPIATGADAGTAGADPAALAGASSWASAGGAAPMMSPWLYSTRSGICGTRRPAASALASSAREITEKGQPPPEGSCVQEARGEILPSTKRPSPLVRSGTGAGAPSRIHGASRGPLSPRR